MPRPTRVAIIGAGPAGATTACLLARKGASPIIFDDGRRPALVVGESLVPQLTAIFQRLGIEEEVSALGVRKPGVTFAFDEGEDFALSFQALRNVLPNYAYNVPRKEFDRLILDTARAAGARCIPHAAQLVASKDRDEVQLAAESLALVPEWEGAAPDFRDRRAAGGGGSSRGCWRFPRRSAPGAMFRISRTLKTARGQSRTGKS